MLKDRTEHAKLQIHPLIRQYEVQISVIAFLVLLGKIYSYFNRTKGVLSGWGS